MNVSSYEGLSVADATTAILRAGWRNLGNGAAAFCFGKKGSGRVVKIVCGDRGQAEAVKLFQAHPNVAAFPRIYSRADLAEGDCFVVEMERLHAQVDTGDWDEDTRLSIGWNDWDHAEALLGTDAADLLQEASDRLDAGHDLHADNLMLRKDGTVVAVDPFFLGSNYASRNEVRSAMAASLPKAA